MSDGNGGSSGNDRDGRRDRLGRNGERPQAQTQSVPTGRLGRMARLAAVGVRTGAGMILDRDGKGAAGHAAEVLGTMRGLAAKVGQMASYVDGVVPEAHRDAYEGALSKLRSQAPRSSPADVRKSVENELGAPLDRLFARWDDEPIASASIGQVHGAQLGDGTEVVVKVQHAGIAEAVESDLSNAGMLENFAGALGGRRFDTKAMLRVIRERFREELDYELEGLRLDAFAEVHAGDPKVSVPRWVKDCSTRRVLTMHRAYGLSFEEACAHEETERRAWAETLWRFVFKGNLVARQFNADPHPGNYLFGADGAVTFLDFGCVQPIDPKRSLGARRMHGCAIARDEAGFRAAVTATLGSRPGRLETLAIAYSRECFEPLFVAPYLITKSYAASLVDGMKELGILARKLPDDEFFTMPSDMLFINRLQFGFYSVLARMDVAVDYAAVERRFFAEAGFAVA